MTIRRRIARYLMALSLRLDTSDFAEFATELTKLFSSGDYGFIGDTVSAVLAPKVPPPEPPPGPQLRLVR